MDQRSGTMTTAALEPGQSPGQPAQVPEERGQRPGGPQARFQLRNWRVRERVGVLVLIPTIAAIVLGGVRVVSARDTAASFARVDQLASLGIDVTALAEAVEDERDLTAGLVAARQSGDTALLNTITGQLNSQYAVTSSRVATVSQGAGRINSSYPAVAQSDLAALQDQLTTLTALRGLTKTGMTALPIIADYTNLVSVLLTFDNDLAAGSSSPQLAQTVSSLGGLAQMEDEASQQRAILYAELIRGGWEIGAPQTLINAQAAQSSDLAAFESVGQNLPAYTTATGLSPTLTEVQQFNSIVSGPGIDAAEAIEQNALISGDNGQPPIQPTGGPQAWYSDTTNELSTTRQVESDLLASSVAQASALQQGSESSERLTAIIVLVLLLLVIAITILVARSMIVPLRRLRADALDVAERRLPEIVRRLSESQDAEQDFKIELIGINSADEIGEVARAFNQVHREAVRLAGDEAMLRANLNAMFVNLSRRSQTLIERQLGIIDRLEQSEQDGDRLSSLFRLDHLATRMRRNSENLLVLAGHEAPRKWSKPVPLVDVVRAAVSEIEQYERITLGVQPGVTVIGRVASDVVHLVAELAENATVFSPEDTQVVINSQRLQSGGVLLNITDAGLGISDQDLSYANWRLDNPPVVDVAVSRRMGLFVVGRLAARHGIRVRLQHGTDGGLTALVWLPENVAEADTAPPLGQSPRRFEANARAGMAKEYPAVGGTLVSPIDTVLTETRSPVAAAPPRRTAVVRGQESSSIWTRPATRRDTAATPLPPASAQPALAQPTVFTPAAVAVPPPVLAQAPAQPTAVPEPESGPRPDGTPGRLPIFDSVESDWFRRGGAPISKEAESVPSSPGVWTSPADEGFRAAQAAASPATSEVTRVGLPKRVPSANLIPGKVGRDAGPQGGTRRPPSGPTPKTGDEVRKAADANRHKMTSLQRGAREGRAAAPAEGYETDEN